MTKAKILLGLLVVLFLAICGCRNTPECPEQNTSIVIDDVDTMSFQIVTADADTMSLQIVVPVVKRNGQLERSSIVIDDVDMSRMIMNGIDTAKYNIEIRERQPEKDTLARQQSLNLQKLKSSKIK